MFVQISVKFVWLSPKDIEIWVTLSDTDSDDLDFGKHLANMHKCALGWKVWNKSVSQLQ